MPVGRRGGSATCVARSLWRRATLPDLPVSQVWNTVAAMTDPVDTSAGSITSSNRPKRARVDISELTLIVRPPGNPAAVQAFTDAEADEAHRYATSIDAQVEPLAGT